MRFTTRVLTRTQPRKQTIELKPTTCLQLDMFALQVVDKSPMTKKDTDRLIAYKDRLYDQLTMYLGLIASNPNFKAYTAPNTMLGVLIDTQRSSFFKTKQTTTRELVNMLTPNARKI